jgi:hypothetical protein
MFGRRTSVTAQAQVTAGARYRHRTELNKTSVVRVIAVSETRGIPHVRYQLEFERAPGELEIDGPRLLCMEAFTSLYREPAAV